MQTILGFSEHLTQKANLKHTRYGWLRLTPAHSVHCVSEILDAHPEKNPVVLDPFCGTGTTALVCAERGIESDTTDINPFLLWLTRTKTRQYTPGDLAAFENNAPRVEEALGAVGAASPWLPALHQIEKWWDEKTLLALGRAMEAIGAIEKHVSDPAVDLLKIVFLRVLIARANVSFSHQSMSFKKVDDAANQTVVPLEPLLTHQWKSEVGIIRGAACSVIVKEPRPVLCDARDLSVSLLPKRYDCVITSPPYPNRMSYIRELRPYMYWLGYLGSGRDAGEMDWQAIGGTWGCATSNVGKWKPDTDTPIPYDDFDTITKRIAQTSPLLSRYVQKYFYDMVFHTQSLHRVVKPGGAIHYIVGNSKFYDVLLPVEEIFASLFRDSGFENVSVRAIRKRSSKKELFEYVVSADKPV